MTDTVTQSATKQKKVMHQLYVGFAHTPKTFKPDPMQQSVNFYFVGVVIFFLINDDSH